MAASHSTASGFPMRFFSVAERELRAAARRRSTYFFRWLTGLAFFGLLLWLLWVMDGFRNRRIGPELLGVLSVLTFFYCLILGTARTADCISSEKREGTLGLLFLTNLNSAEIVIGKLCSHALATVYGLLAVFPILGLPLLMGGITFEEFGRTLLALLNAIFCSLAAGLLASVLFTRQFPAVAFATGVAVVWGAGLLGVAAILDDFKGNKAVVELLALACPLYALITADGTRLFGGNHFWQSLIAVAAISAAGVLAVTWKLARSWRDRPQVVRNWNWWRRGKKETRRGNPAGRARLRRRLLDINPFYWLAGRKLVSAPVFMVLMLILVVITAYVTTPFFGGVMRGESYAPMLGSLLAWLWAGMAVHVLVFYYAAMVASQRLAEDKQTGALEMILCTPTTERSISRGLWLAYARRLAFPANVAILTHAFFIWQCMIMALLDPPGNLPPGVVSPSEFFWAILWNEPVLGQRIEWAFVFMMHTLLLLLVLAAVVWITLGWVARWLGLRMKHPGFAPLVALALVFAPPILEFSFICYVFGETGFFRMSERKVLPILMWVAFAVGVLHCVLVSWWAAGRLRRDLRAIVTSRFQPLEKRRWWRPTGRGIAIFMVRTGVAAAVLVLVVTGFYGYQNWRAERDWKQFQALRQQRGEAVNFALPPSAILADADNFAAHPRFREVVFGPSSSLRQVFSFMNELDTVHQRYGNDLFAAWPQQHRLPLAQAPVWFNFHKTMGGQTNQAVVAPRLLASLTNYADVMRDWAEMAQRQHYQIATNTDAETVLRSVRPETTAFERMQFMFVLRAVAAVEVGAGAQAGDDVVTSLKLARLAAQTSDARASIRQQVLLGRTLQPLWEGLWVHRWNEPQLAALEQELGRFNLLADHTNAIHRLVNAYVQLWQSFPARPEIEWAVPEAAGGFTRDSEWKWEPRAWWYDRCRQLYDAGQVALRKVDFTNGIVQTEQEWELLDGLPVGNDAEQLLQPYYWGQSKFGVMAYAATALHQARLAVALERYWLAHGAYPENLEALVPEYLEKVLPDIVTGRPMKYERVPNHAYSLTSVGPDGEFYKQNVSSDDDWRWAYPTATNAVPPGAVAP
jgi:ABC-type transport system involved in cytochrome c biogenesis permease component